MRLQATHAGASWIEHRRRASRAETMSEEVDESPPWPAELTLTAGPAANGGSCVARHEGRVVFVRYVLPGETVKVRVVGDHGSYWHADVVEVIEPSADRIDSLCPIAGRDGAGFCDPPFPRPEPPPAPRAG